MTLRKIKWMADGKREHEYDLNIHLINSLSESFAGTFKPADANPFRPNVANLLKSEKRKKRESEQGFKVLGKYLGLLRKKR